MVLNNMQPRLARYRQFIEEQFLSSLTWNTDYSLERLSDRIRDAAKRGMYRKILFTGMGCSAIVSDVVKGFLAAEHSNLYIEVINDYDINYLFDVESLKNDDTLVVISSYSGHSQEPIMAYEKIKAYTDNIIFLTTGGKLQEIADKDDVSLMYWRLRSPDREYPLFHVPQYLGILLDVFFELGLLSSNYLNELSATQEFLKSLDTQNAKTVAQQLHDREIMLLASPKWHLSLLKLATMHFNEMAMAPAHRNFFNEFTHSEIAALSNPSSPKAVMLFEDPDENDYTKKKIANTKALLTSDIPQNANITYLSISLQGDTFLKKLFSALLFVQQVSLALGEYYDTPSRELISLAAGNPWYNQKTIQNEQVSTP